MGLVQSDVLRKTLFGKEKEDRTLNFAAGKYSPEANEHLYRALLKCAEDQISNNTPVVIDASFIKAEHRNMLAEMSSRLGIPYVFTWCTLDLAQTKQRLKKRALDKSAISDGRAELLEQQQQVMEKPNSEELPSLLEIDTADPIDRQTQQVIAALRKL